MCKYVDVYGTACRLTLQQAAGVTRRTPGIGPIKRLTPELARACTCLKDTLQNAAAMAACSSLPVLISPSQAKFGEAILPEACSPKSSMPPRPYRPFCKGQSPLLVSMIKGNKTRGSSSMTCLWKPHQLLDVEIPVVLLVKSTAISFTSELFL